MYYCVIHAFVPFLLSVTYLFYMLPQETSAVTDWHTVTATQCTRHHMQQAQKNAASIMVCQVTTQERSGLDYTPLSGATTK